MVEVSAETVVMSSPRSSSPSSYRCCEAIQARHGQVGQGRRALHLRTARMTLQGEESSMTSTTAHTEPMLSTMHTAHPHIRVQHPSPVLPSPLVVIPGQFTPASLGRASARGHRQPDRPRKRQSPPSSSGTRTHQRVESNKGHRYCTGAIRGGPRNAQLKSCFGGSTGISYLGSSNSQKEK